MDFLSEIIAVKRQRLAAAITQLPPAKIRDRALSVRQLAPRHAFAAALRSEARINLIAEFKRRSPSKGRINSDADPAVIAQIYESAGAAAISVLTEEDYFDGSLEDLRLIKEAVKLPVIRKDFILDEYQVYETAAARADALLLICAALDDDTLTRLRALAEDELGMDALVEVHTKAEVDRAVACGARLIGVNNRDLRTFTVSVATSEALAQVAGREVLLVSESGLTPDAVQKLRSLGYRGFLVGETLMRATDPGTALREFLNEPEKTRAPRSVWIKICGITNVEDARAAIAAGADMLGFNFYRRSPRFVESKAAAEIVNEIQTEISNARRPISLLGVFVNEPLKEVLRIADDVRLNGIQLHGDETVTYCEQLKELSPQRFVIKVSSENDIETLAGYPTDAIMIDAVDPKLRGGTGRVADWAAARDAADKLPRVFLAGGLSPENVGAAIAAVRPYAVDACSSLETVPGKKDARRMKEFVDAVWSSKLPDESSVA